MFESFYMIICQAPLNVFTQSRYCNLQTLQIIQVTPQGGTCHSCFFCLLSTKCILEVLTLFHPFLFFTFQNFFDILFCFVLELQEGEAAAEETKKSNHVQRKIEKRQKDRNLDPHIEEQFGGGRLLACISSRPGQCGRSDG